jgi:hypothetical protein
VGLRRAGDDKTVISFDALGGGAALPEIRAGGGGVARVSGGDGEIRRDDGGGLGQ